MRKFLISVVLLALLTSACGGGKKNDTPASTVEGIKGALLLASDFGPAYKRTSLDVDKRESSPIGCDKLDQVDAQYMKTTQHTADAGFQNGDDSPTQIADEIIYSFKNVDDANAYFDGQVAGFDACKTFSSTDPDGTQTSGSLQPYTFPTIAEESYASTMTINNVSGGQAQSIAGPVVLLRKGTTFLGLLFFHVGAQPGLSGGEIEAIVRKAADKI